MGTTQQDPAAWIRERLALLRDTREAFRAARGLAADAATDMDDDVIYFERKLAAVT